MLSNPVINEDKKKEVVKQLAAEASFSQYTTNFLNLLIDQSRVEALESICESFEKSYCALTDTQVRACARAACMHVHVCVCVVRGMVCSGCGAVV
jgi:hypothetical protein